MKKILTVICMILTVKKIISILRPEDVEILREFLTKMVIKILRS